MVNNIVDFWRGKRVLITGNTGFKGSWLTTWLLNLGANVWGYALPPELRGSIYEYVDDFFLTKACTSVALDSHYADIRSLDDLKKYVGQAQPDIVFHLAAQPLVRKSYRFPLMTWEVNVQGTLNLLDALTQLNTKCAVVVVTTDKVYKNRGWEYGYRENDLLGGCDPYSASKAAAELALESWRTSYCDNESGLYNNLRIASARAGNVIGGGDWAEDRLVPDLIRSIQEQRPVSIRNPLSTRPWQHVLESLFGYMLLAQKLFDSPDYINFTAPFNFGPSIESTRTVKDLIDEVFLHWPGTWCDLSDQNHPYEAQKLHLNTDKAYNNLGWSPRWNFPQTIEKTVQWYRAVASGANPVECCLHDINCFFTN